RLDNAVVTAKEKNIAEEFPNERLLSISERPWFADMANFKAGNVVPKDYTWQQKKKLFHDAKQYWWDDPYIFKERSDGLMRRCVAGAEARSIMWHCHDS
ncbi:hypothetical protein A2U01_0063592, partial [Trifolium medium]|nr:hypothetical protein [Trifolium medium]